MAWPDDLVPRSRMGFRRHGRGASPPAIPCFFVAGHHAPCLNRGSRPDDVVPHRSRALVSSSSSTTSHRLIRARGRAAWCLTARKPLFLRRGAPRRMGESEHGDERRGASPPASPCFFVAGHHAPDFLQPDNSGNPPRVPGIPISPKKRKLSARCCSRNTLSTFPFPLSISRDCPLCTLRGQSLS